MMIDQGFCFNGVEWNFPDSPLRGLYCHKSVYDCVRGMDQFEPWLNLLDRKIDGQTILRAAKDIPTDWYESDHESLARLVQMLDRRRSRVRELLRSARQSNTSPFANWPRELTRFA
jgi:hypothetical protein